MLQKILRHNVQSADVPLFTWEVVTGFDEELPKETLHTRFDEEFRDAFADKTPVFFKLVSFNGLNGRRHRYLVALKEKDESLKRKNSWQLPLSIVLYRICDKIMREGDGLQNLCYHTTVAGKLYILVFLEGRLCHWSEELGYGNAFENPDVALKIEERLERFRHFLEKDDLFSRAESFAFESGCDDGPSPFSREEFLRAAADPFWRRKSLTPSDKSSHVRFAFVTFLLAVVVSLVVFVPTLTAFFESEGLLSNESVLEAEAPELLLPEPIESFEVRAIAESLPKSVKRPSCDQPEFKLRGLVEGKICQLHGPDGTSSWLREGELVGGFRVESIGRDRVVLECGGVFYDVFSGV